MIKIKPMLAVLALLVLLGISNLEWMVSHPASVTSFEDWRWRAVADDHSALKVSFFGCCHCIARRL